MRRRSSVLDDAIDANDDGDDVCGDGRREDAAAETIARLLLPPTNVGWVLEMAEATRRSVALIGIIIVLSLSN
jgi:hypothetical protein